MTILDDFKDVIFHESKTGVATYDFFNLGNRISMTGYVGTGMINHIIPGNHLEFQFSWTFGAAFDFLRCIAVIGKDRLCQRRDLLIIHPIHQLIQLFQIELFIGH